MYPPSPARDSGISIYGDGTDGVALFDGTTVVKSMTPNTNVYTLDRDYYFSSITGSTGVTVITNGFRLFCSGILHGSGTFVIKWNGLSASGTNGSTGGTVTGNTNASTNNAVGTNAPGTAGANGGTGNGANGGASAALSTVGGRGGSGGTGVTTTAGAAGTVFQTLLTTQGGLHAFPFALFGFVFTGGNAIQRLNGGTGGGSGGGDGTNAGGGGGAGGGIVIVSARQITGIGAIQARGGDGGIVTTSTLGAGGGGGGGGGFLSVISTSILNGAITGWILDANGGAAGTGLGVTFTNGVKGSDGLAVLIGD